MTDSPSGEPSSPKASAPVDRKAREEKIASAFQAFLANQAMKHGLVADEVYWIVHDRYYAGARRK